MRSFTTFAPLFRAGRAAAAPGLDARAGAGAVALFRVRDSTRFAADLVAAVRAACFGDVGALRRPWLAAFGVASRSGAPTRRGAADRPAGPTRFDAAGAVRTAAALLGAFVRDDVALVVFDGAGFAEAVFIDFDAGPVACGLAFLRTSTALGRTAFAAFAAFAAFTTGVATAFTTAFATGGTTACATLAIGGATLTPLAAALPVCAAPRVVPGSGAVGALRRGFGATAGAAAGAVLGRSTTSAGPPR